MNRRDFLKTMAQGAAVAAAARVVPAAAQTPNRMTLAAVGDCIVTRKLSHLRDPDFLAVAELLRGVDCAWGNCEVVLADSRAVYPALKGGDPHTIAPPWGADELAWMGIDFVGTANNHTLDFGNEGMFSTLENLDRVGIAHAGAGADLALASRPGYADTSAGRIGQVNCTATFLPFFMAGPAHPHLRGRPGVNMVRRDEKFQVDRKIFDSLKQMEKKFEELQGYNEFAPMMQEELARIPKDEWYFGDRMILAGDGTDHLSAPNPGDLTRVTDALKVARNNSRLVIASIHSHEARHKLEISDPFLQPFARACIDAGADAFFSAGPHVMRGIEIYKGKPIFYSLSNFIFQHETSYPVAAEDFATYGLEPGTLDPSLFSKKIFYHEQKRFWQSFVPKITYEDGRVVEIEIHPVSLGFGKPLYERGTPVMARGEEGKEVLDQLAALSKPFGTRIEIQDGIGRVVLAERG